MLFAGGCGGDDGASQAEIERERGDAAQQARQEERIKQLEREQRNLKKEKAKSGGGGGGSSGANSGRGSGPTPSAGSGRTQCGGGLSVGANTSCPFAQAVRDAYNASGQSSNFTAYSTVTGKDYAMSCSSGSPHVCTGGNNASVYFP